MWRRNPRSYAGIAHMTDVPYVNEARLRKDLRMILVVVSGV